MGKGVLKYGGKSGILPKIRPVFKGNPIRAKLPFEREQEAKVEKGFAEGIPLPKRRGYTFHRVEPEKEVLSVKERIARTIDRKSSENVDLSKLTEREQWAIHRDTIRREFLRSAYLTEAKRLERIDKIKEEQYKKKKKAEAQIGIHEESEAVKLTIPTIESYLKGPIMRQRTKEEQILVEEQRTLNRRTQELEEKSAKATQLLDLYHAASNFITTEEELEAAIVEAFEVRVTDYDRTLDQVKNKLNSAISFSNDSEISRKLIEDRALGEINGKPGLETVKDILSGHAETIRREAEVAVNHDKNF
ncbi:mitochondrial ribosomal protein of small subunit [Scheffersomyces amazonensis]|uniref:mitochondrial ribosomal protein of small subunit n=1 Tax=Scheffersomyces amazonensis TaxID=1078765 RepID=UPI00315D5180